MLEEDSYIGLAYDPANMSVMWPAGTLGAKPLVKFKPFSYASYSNLSWQTSWILRNFSK